MSKRILRVAVLGQGRSGYDIHVRWLREAPGQYKVVAVADEMPERLVEARDQLGARTYSDYRALLADRSLELDLVVNALPSFLHPTGAIAALKAGHHVVCEKPQGRCVKDFDQVVAAARKAKRQYLPFQNSRFYPYFQKMREVMASGKLGKIVYIRGNWSGFGRRWDWQTIQQYWGGNLLNTGPHPTDHAVVLFGPKTPNVFARMASQTPWGDADNFSMFVLYGPGSPTVEMMINSFQAYPQGEQYNVCGALGGLSGNAAGLHWKYFDPKKAPKHVLTGKWSENRQYCGEKLDWIEESWTPPPAPVEGFQLLSKGFYDNVYDVLVNKAKSVITHDEVRRQMHVFEQCRKQNPLPTLKKNFLKGKKA